ncbi:MAG: phosphatidate cytidylyltransferase [Desulfobulbaceae bacterium]|jgi:phosphatidate cytidylyltransferase|nr:phosphatidate cytidylyltransferase [Desulfobulbaceae bacterium]
MRREVTGCVLVLLWLILLIFGSAGQFWLVTTIIAGFAASEYLAMQFPDGLPKTEYGVLLAIIVLPVLLQISGAVTMPVAAYLFAAFFFYCLYRFMFFKEMPVDLTHFGKVALGLFYIGLLFAHLPMIRNLPHGHGGAWVLILTAITAGSDIGAYYVGRYCGKSKLCPEVSPSKTKEGMWGGVATAIVLAVIVKLAVDVPLGTPSLILLAVFLSFISVFGDLVESAIKRSVGVKDSGTPLTAKILPGHGGVLDRLDSMIFAAPVLYYFLIWVVYK